MRKIVVLTLLSLLLSGCGKAAPQTIPQTTAAPATTAAVTEAPTTVATEPPTTAPTEPPRPWVDNVLRCPNPFQNPTFDFSIWGDNRYSRKLITEVTFLDTLKDMPADAWDVSEAGNGSVMAWYDLTSGYHLYIAGEGGVMAPEDCCCMFFDYNAVKAIHFNGNLHTEETRIMEGMFMRCMKLESLDISTLDTSSNTNMISMFNECSTLETLDLSSMDTSQVTNMEKLFIGNTRMKEVNLTGWDTSNVTNMKGMFESCKALERVDLSHFDTSKVENMEGMFAWTPALKELELGQWETDSVTNYNNFLRGSAAPQAGTWYSLFQKEE